MTSQPPPLAEVDEFLQAQAKFVHSLSAEERAAYTICHTPVQLIEDFRHLGNQSDSQHDSTFRKAISKVKSFSDRILPYNDAISTIVQSHPEIAGIIWGLMKVSLTLASNYITFFERFADTLEKLASKLPQLQGIPMKLRKLDIDPSPRLSCAIQKIYLDVLHFFQGVTEIFRKKSGAPRRTVWTTINLAFTSFDIRFQALVERINLQDRLVKTEVQLAFLEIAVINRGRQLNADASQRQQMEDIKVEMGKTMKQAENTATGVDEIRKQINENQSTLEKEIQQLKEQGEWLAKSIEGSIKTLLHEERVKQERFEQAKHIDRIRNWINPPNFARAYEDNTNARTYGTCKWLFERREFQQWILNTHPRSDASTHFSDQALWITGNPGNGKSVLAAASIDKLVGDSPSNCCCYFFFSELSHENRKGMAYRSFASQLLQFSKRRSDILDIFSFAITESQNGQGQASENELLDLLDLCTQSMEDLYVILDGIDECCEQRLLIHDLQNVFAHRKLKLLFFSRPNVRPLMQIIPENQCFGIGKSTNADIRQFVKDRLDQLLKDNLLPPAMDMTMLNHCLVTGADGMFLWAQLMMDILNLDVILPQKRVRIILESAHPEGIDSIYDRIMNHISQGSRLQQQIAKWIIAWIFCSKRSLKSSELRESVRLLEVETNEEVYDEKHFEQVVITSCACLVKISKLGKTSTFEFAHLSAKDYIKQKAGESGSLSVSPSYSTMEFFIARGCVQYMLSCIPGTSSTKGSSVTSARIKLGQSYPLLEYSSTYVTHHICDAIERICIGSTALDMTGYHDFIHILSLFLSRPDQISAWIEVHYTFGATFELSHLDLALENAKHVPGLARSSVFLELQSLCRDLKSLQINWSRQLSENPSCIWQETASFLNSRFLSQSGAIEVQTLKPSELHPETLSSVNLTLISEVSFNRHYVGVLGIWPSREYEELAKATTQTLSWTDTIKEILYKHSSGWAFRYQVFYVGGATPKLVFDRSQRLDRDKVWTQLQQSLWMRGNESAAAACRLQFPTSISKSLHRFAILGDVYNVTALDNGSRFTLRKCTLPSYFNDCIRRSWERESVQDFNNNSSTPHSFDSWIHRHCSIYLYWLRFSSDGRFALFIDKAPSMNHNIAVFDFGHDESSSGPTLLCHHSISLYGGNKDMRSEIAVFHPKIPLLAFTVVSNVWLWAYEDVAPPTLVYSGIDLSYQSITFSDCGKYINVQVASEELCSTIDIPDGLRGNATLLGQSTRPVFTNGPAATSLFSCLGGTSNEIQTAGLTKGVTVTRGSSDSLHLAFQEQSQGRTSRTAFHVSRVPDTYSAERESLTLIPSIHDERVRVILGLVSQKWYNLDSTKQYDDMPAIIGKSYKSFTNLDVTAEEEEELYSNQILDSPMDEGLFNDEGLLEDSHMDEI